MEDFKNLQPLSENNIQICSSAIALAMERTGTEFLDIKKTSVDIINSFPDVKIEMIVDAMKRGGLGEFGRTYKLTIQEICIWIRSVEGEKRRNNAMMFQT